MFITGFNKCLGREALVVFQKLAAILDLRNAAISLAVAGKWEIVCVIRTKLFKPRDLVYTVIALNPCLKDY